MVAGIISKEDNQQYQNSASDHNNIIESSGGGLSKTVKRNQAEFSYGKPHTFQALEDAKEDERHQLDYSIDLKRMGDESVLNARIWTSLQQAEDGLQLPD